MSSYWLFFVFIAFIFVLFKIPNKPIKKIRQKRANWLHDNEASYKDDSGETAESTKNNYNFEGRIGQFNYSEAYLKGKAGEAVIGSFSEALGKDYRILKNVVIRMGNGTTQIDQIIVSKFGIFVLEIKNYAGWIFGKEKQQKWTQRFWTGHTFQFQNPLIQNERHIAALRNLLKIPQTKFLSVVVFTGNKVQIKTFLPANVTMGRNYLGYIRNHRNPLFTDIEVSNIVKKISDNRLSDADHQLFMDKLRN